MKDWSIILVRNTTGTIFQRAYWSLLRWGSGVNYNHCQLVREFNGTLWICESDLSGFRVTKTLDKWKAEQATMKRTYLVVDMGGYSEERFNEILGNKYDAKYWTYLTKRYSPMDSSNCFQSIAYIFGFPKYWLATANTFL
jgi:hypothetical protein